MPKLVFFLSFIFFLNGVFPFDEGNSSIQIAPEYFKPSRYASRLLQSLPGKENKYFQLDPAFSPFTMTIGKIDGAFKNYEQVILLVFNSTWSPQTLLEETLWDFLKGDWLPEDLQKETNTWRISKRYSDTKNLEENEQDGQETQRDGEAEKIQEEDDANEKPNEMEGDDGDQEKAKKPLKNRPNGRIGLFVMDGYYSKPFIMTREVVGLPDYLFFHEGIQIPNPPVSGLFNIPQIKKNILEMLLSTSNKDVNPKTMNLSFEEYKNAFLGPRETHLLFLRNEKPQEKPRASRFKPNAPSAEKLLNDLVNQYAQIPNSLEVLSAEWDHEFLPDFLKIEEEDRQDSHLFLVSRDNEFGIKLKPSASLSDLYSKINRNRVSHTSELKSLLDIPTFDPMTPLMILLFPKGTPDELIARGKQWLEDISIRFENLKVYFFFAFDQMHPVLESFLDIRIERTNPTIVGVDCFFNFLYRKSYLLPKDKEVTKDVISSFLLKFFNRELQEETPVGRNLLTPRDPLVHVSSHDFKRKVIGSPDDFILLVYNRQSENLDRIIESLREMTSNGILQGVSVGFWDVSESPDSVIYPKESVSHPFFIDIPENGYDLLLFFTSSKGYFTRLSKLVESFDDKDLLRIFDTKPKDSFGEGDGYFEPTWENVMKFEEEKRKKANEKKWGL